MIIMKNNVNKIKKIKKNLNNNKFKIMNQIKINKLR